MTHKSVKVVEFGNAYFASKVLNVLHMGAQFIFDSREVTERSHVTPRSLESIVIEHEGKRTVLAHFHGVWIKGNTKGDCPERDEQSQSVLEALERLARQYDTDRVIVGGDFNLDINTRALAALGAGLPSGKLQFRNLIREYGITDTRTPHYRHYDKADHSKYADYVLVTSAVTVESFGLCGKDASDHAHPQTTFS